MPPVSDIFWIQVDSHCMPYLISTIVDSDLPVGSTGLGLLASGFYLTLDLNRNPARVKLNSDSTETVPQDAISTTQ